MMNQVDRLLGSVKGWIELTTPARTIREFREWGLKKEEAVSFSPSPHLLVAYAPNGDLAVIQVDQQLNSLVVTERFQGVPDLYRDTMVADADRGVYAVTCEKVGREGRSVIESSTATSGAVAPGIGAVAAILADRFRQLSPRTLPTDGMTRIATLLPGVDVRMDQIRRGVVPDAEVLVEFPFGMAVTAWSEGEGGRIAHEDRLGEVSTVTHYGEG